MTVERRSGADGHPADRLVDVLDRLIDRGVVIRAELWLGVADVDLVFIGAELLVSTPEGARAREAGPPTSNVPVHG